MVQVLYLSFCKRLCFMELFFINIEDRTHDFQTQKYTDYIRLLNKIKVHPILIPIEYMFLEINNYKRLWMNLNYFDYKSNKINNLPDWYSQYYNTDNLSDSSESSLNNNVYCICLDNFDNMKSVKSLECNHLFHRFCIIPG